ncbi:hypothetical protein H0H93_011651 [Arthromyces matolae]|nr:hypothetical protein H0H93_011651 [Arthromyces matolae]
MTNSPPQTWTPGNPRPKLWPNKLAQNAHLIQEAVNKCNQGDCKHYGEGKQGIAWLVALSDRRQHILKVMFAHDTQNRFTLQKDPHSWSSYPKYITTPSDFAKLVYMTNRVTQLEAFGVLEDHSNHQIAFYMLMPYMGLSFRLAFDTYPREFTNDGVYAWAEQGRVISAYEKSYGIYQSDYFSNNFVFNEQPWDVRLVDWSEGVDHRFRGIPPPTYDKIAHLVVKVEDKKEGYYNDETNNNHEENKNEREEFFKQLEGEIYIMNNGLYRLTETLTVRLESSSKAPATTLDINGATARSRCLAFLYLVKIDVLT